MSIAAVSSVITVASTIYSVMKGLKAAKKAKAAADARKGFEIPVEGEIGPLPIVYGRARVAGYRVYHDVSSDYVFQQPAADGLTFLTSGDSRTGFGEDFSKPVAGSINVTLYESPPGEFAVGPPSGSAWTEDTTRVLSIPFNGTPAINRTSTNSNYTVMASSHQFEFLLVNATVTLRHEPWNYDPNRQYRDLEGNILPAPGNIEHAYRIISYDDNSGILMLTGLFNANTLIYDNVRYNQGRLINTNSPALAASDGSKKRKREFLFIQQVFCYKGINKVFYIELADKDYRDPEFGESGRIYIYPGGDVVDPMMSANFPARANARFPETAYGSMAFKLDRDEPQYAGVPDVVIQCEGLKVLRFTDDQGTLGGGKSYSNNPAEILLDYLTNSDYGKGLNLSEIDLRSFARVAEICDTPVAIGGNDTFPAIGKLWTQKVAEENLSGKQLKRFEFNGVLNSGATVRENIGKILATMGSDAVLLWSQGQYKLKLHYPEIFEEGKIYPAGSVIQWTDDFGRTDIYKASLQAWLRPDNPNSNQWKTGAQKIAEGVYPYDDDLCVAYFTDDSIELENQISQSWTPLSDKYNYCTVTFNNEEKNFDADSVSWPDKYPTDLLDSVYQTYLNQDNGILLETSETLDGVTDYHHAKAHAEEVVRSSRHKKSLVITVSRKHFYIEPGDLVNVNSDALGIPGVVFQVNSVKTNPSGSLDLTCTTFNASILAWNAPDNEVIDIQSPYSVYPVGQASQLQYITHTTAEGNLLRSGTLTWAYAQGNDVTYDVKYVAKPASAVVIGDEWLAIGSTKNLQIDIPILREGYVTFTVVARDREGNIAPEWDVALGVGWPKLEVLIGSSSLVLSSALVKAYRYSRDDIEGSVVIPPGDLAFSGTFDFNGMILVPPIDWSVDPDFARVAATAEYKSDVVGNLYSISSTVNVTYPETFVMDLEWSNVVLNNDTISEKELIIYYRRPAGTPTPLTPGSDALSSSGSYFFGFNDFIPPTSNEGTIEWSLEIPVGQGVVYQSKATATIRGVYGLNTNELLWSNPIVYSDVATVSETVRLFRWSSAFPLNSELTGVTSQMTWEPSRSHGGLDGPAPILWSLTLPPSNPGFSERAYEAYLNIQAETGQAFTTVDWSSPEVIIREAAASVSRQLVYLYRWDFPAPRPAKPLSTSVYTWSTGSIAPLPEGWYAEIPEYPGAGFVLFRLGGQITDSATAVTTTINWSAGHFAVESMGATPPASKFRSYVFKRGLVQPNVPLGGSFSSPLPDPLDGWEDGVLSGSGTLWSSNRLFTENGETPQDASWSTPVDVMQDGAAGVDGTWTDFEFSNLETPELLNDLHWTDIPGTDALWMRTQKYIQGAPQGWAGPIRIKGEVGIPGEPGIPGVSSITAFTEMPLATVFVGPRTAEGVVPPNDLWGLGEIWSELPVSPVANNNKLFMTIGIHNEVTNITQWKTPFWASLEVGSLSAITVSTGSLDVDGDITVSGGGNIRRGKVNFDSLVQGFWLGSAGDVHVGDAGSFFRYNDAEGVKIKADLSSNNYTATTGWQLTQAGNATINNLTVRDPVTGADIISLGNENSAGIDGGYIKQLSVDTLQIAGEAVVVPRYSSTFATHNLETGVNTEVLYIDYIMEGLPSGQTVDVIIMSNISTYPQDMGKTTLIHRIYATDLPPDYYDPPPSSGTAVQMVENNSSTGGSDHTFGQFGDGVVMQSMWWDYYIGGLSSYEISATADVLTAVTVLITPYWSEAVSGSATVTNISGTLELGLKATDLMGQRAVAEATLVINGGAPIPVPDLVFASNNDTAHTVTLPFSVDTSVTGSVYSLTFQLNSNVGGLGSDVLAVERVYLYNVQLGINGGSSGGVPEPDPLPAPYIVTEVGATIEGDAVNSTCLGMLTMGNGIRRITSALSLRKDHPHNADTKPGTMMDASMVILGGKR